MNAVALRIEPGSFPQVPPPPAQPRVVVLASGKSGQGTTTVACLLGILGSAERRTLLVDGTGSGALGARLSGVGPRGFGAGEDGSGRERIVEVADRLSLVTVHRPKAEDDAAPSFHQRARLRWLPPLFTGFESVVIDAGCQMATIAELCLSTAGQVLVVTTPDRVAVTGAYALIKVLGDKAPAPRIQVLLNGASAREGAEVFHDLEMAVQLFLGRSVAYVGAVPEDSSIRAAETAAEPLHHLPFDAPGVAAVHDIAVRLCREQATVHSAVGRSRLPNWR